MSATYEIEIKSLLGEASEAERLKAALLQIDPNATCRSSYTQINHYFEGGDVQKLAEVLSTKLSPEASAKVQTIADKGTNLSIRSREMNGEVRMVLKASIGGDSSANGVTRLEVEEPVSLSLQELDDLILSCGYTYQAKWSRSREEYGVGDVSVCLDKNAGYGYLAEFEKVVGNEAEAGAAKQELEALMKELGVSELPQDRLERMFTYYNLHWPEYYGTEKVFVIE